MARQGEGVPPAIALGRLDLGVRDREVGEDAEARHPARQEAELLLPVQLQPHQMAVRRVDRGLVGVGGRVRLADDRTLDLVVQDVAIIGQVLVEDVGRDHAQRGEVVFQTGVEVIRQCRLQIRVANLVGNIQAVRFLDTARHDLAEFRTRDRARQGQTTNQIVAEGVADGQVGEELGVVAADLDRRDRRGIVFVEVDDAQGHAVELGLLDTQAHRDVGGADVEPRLTITGQDVFLSRIVRRQRVRHAARRRTPGRSQIGVDQALVVLIAQMVAEVASLAVAPQGGQRAGIGRTGAVALTLFVGVDLASSVFQSELPGDVTTGELAGDFDIGAEGDVFLLGRVRAEGVLPEREVAGRGEEAGRRVAEDGIARGIGVAGRIVVAGVVAQRRRRRAIDQLVAVRIGLLAVGPGQVGVPDHAVAEGVLAAQDQGGDLVILGAMTQAAIDAGAGVGRRRVRSAGLQGAVGIAQDQGVAVLVVLEVGVGPADVQASLIRRAPFQGAGQGLTGALGLILLEQGLLEHEDAVFLDPGVLDVLGAAVGLGIAERQEGAEGLVRTKDVRDRGPGAGVVAAVVIIAAAGVAAERQTAGVEGRARLDVDRAGDRVGVLAGQQRLGDFDVGDDVAGQGVQVDRAGARIDRRNRHAVHRHGGEGRRGAAHVDVAAFALVTLDGDAGDALQRLGDVGIGVAADSVRRQDVDRAVGVLLLVQRASDAVGDDARHHHVGDRGRLAAVHRHRNRGQASRRRHDRLAGRRQADVAHVQFDLAGNARQNELALGVADHAAARAPLDDLGARQGRALGVDHAADHPVAGRLDHRARRDIGGLGRNGEGQRQDSRAQQKAKFHVSHPRSPGRVALRSMAGLASGVRRRDRDGFAKRNLRTDHRVATNPPETKRLSFGRDPFVMRL
ncbi:hypothetical protein D3C86_1060270 [compost metagenome]